MKILFVVSRPIEINTSASIRNRAVIAGLIESGHTVDYLSSVPDKNHANFDDSLALDVNKSYYFELGGVQKVAKLGRKFVFLKSVKKIAYKAMQNRNIYDNLKGICNFADVKNVDINGYDLVISSSDPKSSHLFVNEFFDRYGKEVKWYQIWGDPFLDDITHKGDKKKNRLVFIEEKKLLTKADKVFYVTLPTLYKQKEIYGTESYKMNYMPIPYEKKINYKRNNINKLRIKFLYTGDYNSKIRNIRPLIDSLEQTDHELIICGDSDIDIKSSKNIKIFSRQNYKKIKEFEEDADILVHLSNLTGTQIPGKIYQYSGTNKPILFILDGESESILKNFSDIEDRYIFCQNTKEDILNTINDTILNFDNYKPVEKFNKINVVTDMLKEN